MQDCSQINIMYVTLLPVCRVFGAHSGSPESDMQKIDPLLIKFHFIHNNMVIHRPMCDNDTCKVFTWIPRGVRVYQRGQVPPSPPNEALVVSLLKYPCCLAEGDAAPKQPPPHNHPCRWHGDGIMASVIDVLSVPRPHVECRECD